MTVPAIHVYLETEDENWYSYTIYSYIDPDKMLPILCFVHTSQDVYFLIILSITIVEIDQ